MTARVPHPTARVSPWLAAGLVTASLVASGCDRLVFYLGVIPVDDGAVGPPPDLAIPPGSCEQVFDLGGLGCNQGPSMTSIVFLDEKPVPVVGAPLAATIADLDGDGRQEVVVATVAGYHVMENPGDGTLRQGALHRLPAHAGGLPLIASHVVAGDFDGDGDLDLAFAAGTRIAFERNDGPCVFTHVTTVSSVIPVSAMHSGFLDGDRIADLAFASQEPSVTGVSQGIIYGGAGMHLKPALTFGFGGRKTSIALLDLDGDGADDMVLADPGTLAAGPSDASIAFGSGLELYFADLRGGVRRDPQTLAVHNRAAGVATADLDGDGARDLMVRYSDPPSDGKPPAGVAILHNNRSAQLPLALPFDLRTDAEPVAVAVADFDHDPDGRADLVIVTGGSTPLLVPVRSAGSMSAASAGVGRPVGAGVTDAFALDLDCDPYPDLVLLHTGVSLGVMLNKVTRP